MSKTLSGRYVTDTTSSEEVRAFVPDPLPPNPHIWQSGELQDLLGRANQALGRLDAIGSLLPDTSLFLYMYVRKEAVLSSQIEGTQSSISDLLLFEVDGTPGAPIDDVVQVSNYVRAVTYGLRRIREDNFPISSRLLCEVHGELLRGSRGGLSAGELRRPQNWIAGSRPGNAIFVPPPHTEVPKLIADLEDPATAGTSDIGGFILWSITYVLALLTSLLATFKIPEIAGGLVSGAAPGGGIAGAAITAGAAVKGGAAVGKAAGKATGG